MTRNNHPIEQEELMAYLDGELATDRAVTAAAHLEHCQECQRLAADLKGVSQKMMEWEVESSGSEIMPDIAAALEEREKQPQKQVVSDRRDLGVVLRGRWLVWAGGLAAVAFFALTIPTLRRSRLNFSDLEHLNSSTYTTDGRLSSTIQQAKIPQPSVGTAGKLQNHKQATDGQDEDKIQSGDD